ncbi:leucine-rich repeat and death domain-containing protein 1-like [Branchiostoma lanceolatum]|uniref:leucine-rich repeat and death domain-containing protein 1-like n=1 Tax=Branchiostoma lanceolatum TaxID=7740 RepID=UPI00345137A2
MATAVKTRQDAWKKDAGPTQCMFLTERSKISHFTNSTHLYLTETIPVPYKSWTLVPQEIGLFRKLTSLTLSNNTLSKKAIANISLCDSLKTLILTCNQITHLPPQIGRLVNLETLDISYNMLTRIQSFVCTLPSLRSLRARHNRIFDVKNIRSLGKSRIITLDLKGNLLQSFNGRFCRSKTLRHLDLSENIITHVVFFKDDLPLLERLDCEGNKIAAFNVMEQRQMTTRSNLRWLSLAKNCLKTFPNAVLRLASLETLDVSQNTLVSIPRAVEAMKHLKSFIASGNHLRSLPRELFCLPQLKLVNVASNRLHHWRYESWDPDDAILSQELHTLILSGNKLESVPPVVYGFPILEHMDLSRNKLRKFPVMFKNKKKPAIVSLDLSHNKLNHFAFAEFDNLRRLRRLNLHHNELTEIPEDITKMWFKSEVTLANNPIKWPPIDICVQGLPAIEEFYKLVEPNKST